MAASAAASAEVHVTTIASYPANLLRSSVAAGAVLSGAAVGFDATGPGNVVGELPVEAGAVLSGAAVGFDATGQGTVLGKRPVELFNAASIPAARKRCCGNSGS